MVVTEKMYIMVRKYSRKIGHANLNTESIDDLIQMVCESLLEYEGEVENLSSFIYISVRNHYYNYVRSLTRTVYREHAYSQTLPAFNLPSGVVEAQSTLSEIVSFITKDSTNAKRIETLSLLIENPETHFSTLAKENNLKYNTFKANVRHLQTSLKSAGYKVVS